jgi:hypothetical protein
MLHLKRKMWLLHINPLHAYNDETNGSIKLLQLQLVIAGKLPEIVTVII